LLFEALFWAAKIDNGSTHSIPLLLRFDQGHWRRVWARTAFVSSAIVYVTSSALVHAEWNIGLSEEHAFELQTFIPRVLIYGCNLCGGFGVVYCVWLDTLWNKHSLAQVYGIPSILCAIFTLVLALVHKFNTLPGGLSLVQGMSVGLGGAGILGASVAMVNAKMVWGTPSADIMRLIGLLHVPLLYYCLVYDSVGTHLPSWLQWLG
jgi:hypothetical protein